jgi:hypothetical protein
MNRRQFIAHTGLATAALGAPLPVNAAAGRNWRVAVIGHTDADIYSFWFEKPHQS